MTKLDKQFIRVCYAFIITLIIFIILSITAVGIELYIENNHVLEYKEVESIELLEFEYIAPNKTKQEMKQDIDKMFNVGHYFYREEDLKEYQIGGLSSIWENKITIDVNASLYNYPFWLAHELTHFTHLTSCEIYCNFVAFKVLYESGDEFYKSVAINIGNNIINGNVPYSYDCGYYILQYIKGEMN